MRQIVTWTLLIIEGSEVKNTILSSNAQLSVNEYSTFCNDANNFEFRYVFTYVRTASRINLADDNAGDTHFSPWLKPSCGISFKVSGLILENDRSLQKCRDEDWWYFHSFFLCVFLFFLFESRESHIVPRIIFHRITVSFVFYERDSRESHINIRESIVVNRVRESLMKYWKLCLVPIKSKET